MLQIGTQIMYVAGKANVVGIVMAAYATAVVVKTTGYVQPDGTIYEPPVMAAHLVDAAQITAAHHPHAN